MTIEQVKILRTQLEEEITEAVQDFEAQTECVVHSIPVEGATKATPAKVRVKVQIGQ